MNENKVAIQKAKEIMKVVEKIPCDNCPLKGACDEYIEEIGNKGICDLLANVINPLFIDDLEQDIENLAIINNIYEGCKL